MSHKLTITITVAEAKALLSAVAEVEAGPMDVWTMSECKALDRAGSALAKQLDKARQKSPRISEDT